MADSSRYEKGCCTCCRKDGDVRWKNLWVIGSEGIWTCHKCEMTIVRFIRDMMRDATRARKAEFLKQRGATPCRPQS